MGIATEKIETFFSVKGNAHQTNYHWKDVDYLALASEEYLGKPKVPTISIYLLNDGQDQVSQFRGSDRLISSIFPKLDLTVEQVVAASLPLRQT